MNDGIKAYNKRQPEDRKPICELLATEIQQALPEAENKVWHGASVWFLDGNPIVGYAVRKESIQLLFWSGQSFEEAGLKPEGSFKAAEARYMSPDQINIGDLNRWLKKAENIQWDYKNIVKRRGKLLRIT